MNNGRELNAWIETFSKKDISRGAQGEAAVILAELKSSKKSKK
jgi:hypothetical protein